MQAISYNMLLAYCKKTAGKYEIKAGDVEKLIRNKISFGQQN